MPRARRDLADPRRGLPSVDELLRLPEGAAAIARFGRGAFVGASRMVLAETRTSLGRAGTEELACDPERVLVAVVARLTGQSSFSLERVINATGVVVHTNLGRAPLSPAAVAAVQAIAGGYSNLEYDLATGGRGDREAHVEEPLRRLLGCEATAAVNNCAAAVLLAVNTFAEGRTVLVSRGELVEIGGSFRIPDILRKSGAALREVGTTNKTRIEDYANALDPSVGLILRVHPSNFRIVGFTASPSLEALAALAARASVRLVDDQGSGLLDAAEPIDGEPTVRDSLAAGADVVTFSGDKLFGGPQAGLAAGGADVIGAMRRNPLYRALRVDKMTLAALHATLSAHTRDGATSELPVLRMSALSATEIGERAARLAAGLRNEHIAADVVDGTSAIGGGAAPTLAIATRLLRLPPTAHSPDALLARLRGARPRVIARIEEDHVVLDLRTVDVADDPALLQALVTACAG